MSMRTGTQPEPISTAQRVTRRVGATARRGIDLILPPLCPSCTAPVADRGAVCGSCWSRLDLIEEPYCARLGIPFAYDLGAGALSAAAIADPPPYERARAVAVYDDVARDLILSLKFHDRGEVAKVLAPWMMRAGRALLADADLIVPVPLHRRRLWSRRFNQSAELAKELSRLNGIATAPMALTRIRATAQQVGLNASQRDANVRGAFAVTKAEALSLRGAAVVLIDDVITSGATIAACSRSLLRAGARQVDVLAFARVVERA